MGPVNLVAIEEYAELRQRYDFLRTQCDDLTSAKAELLKAIDEINRASQRQFAVTFEQVRRISSIRFRRCFGGGHAHLELIQAEDILESGIEIVASARDPVEGNLAALRRPEDADGGRFAFRPLHGEALPFLAARRTGRPARRIEHRAFHEPAEAFREGLAVPHHHAQQAERSPPRTRCTE